MTGHAHLQGRIYSAALELLGPDAPAGLHARHSYGPPQLTVGMWKTLAESTGMERRLRTKARPLRTTKDQCYNVGCYQLEATVKIKAQS